MAPDISRDTKPNIRRRLAAGLISALTLASAVSAPVAAPSAPQVQQSERSAPRPSREQLPSPVRNTQRMARQAIGGGFVAMGPRRDVIWTGRLRDSGFRNAGVHRRRMRGSRR